MYWVSMGWVLRREADRLSCQKVERSLFSGLVSADCVGSFKQRGRYEFLFFFLRCCEIRANNELRIRYKLLRALIKQEFFKVCCVEKLFYVGHISTGYGLSKEDSFFFFLLQSKFVFAATHSVRT